MFFWDVEGKFSTLEILQACILMQWNGVSRWHMKNEELKGKIYTFSHFASYFVEDEKRKEKIYVGNSFWEFSYSEEGKAKFEGKVYEWWQLEGSSFMPETFERLDDAFRDMKVVESRKKLQLLHIKLKFVLKFHLFSSLKHFLTSFSISEKIPNKTLSKCWAKHVTHETNSLSCLH